jgi:hypothetical protein
MNQWNIRIMRKTRAQHQMATIDHVFLCTGTAHAVRVQLTGQIPFPRYHSYRHSFPNSSVVGCSTANQYNVLPKKFNQYLCFPPPLNVDRSTHRHFPLLFSLLPFGFIGYFKVTLLDNPSLLSSIIHPKIRGQTSTTSTSSFHLLAKWAEKSQSQKQSRSLRPAALRRRIIRGPSSTFILHVL